VAASTKADPEDRDLPNDSQQLDDEPSPPSPAKVRKLKIEVSLDGDGYPKMLSSIEPPPIVSEFAIPVPEVAMPDVSMEDWAIDDHLLLAAVMCKNCEALLYKKNIYCTKTKPLLTSFNCNKQTTLQEEQLPKARPKLPKTRHLHIQKQMHQQLHQGHQHVHHLMAPSSGLSEAKIRATFS
jgi:hypothetical protein